MENNLFFYYMYGEVWLGQLASDSADLEQCHHQVGDAQVDHEHVHGRILLSPSQQHPQHEAVAQRGEGQHQAQHGDLGPSEDQIPHHGLRQRVRRRGGRAVVGEEEPEEGAAAAATSGVGAVEGVQLGDKQRRCRRREVAPRAVRHRGETQGCPVRLSADAFHSWKRRIGCQTQQLNPRVGKIGRMNKKKKNTPCAKTSAGSQDLLPFQTVQAILFFSRLIQRYQCHAISIY